MPGSYDLRQDSPGEEVPEFEDVDPGIDVGANKRLPAAILVDNSGSMGVPSNEPPIQEVNRGLEAFRKDLLGDEVAAEVVEVALITFGGRVNGVQNFASPDQFDPPELQAGGKTPMGEAITLAAKLIEERRAMLESQGVSLLAPWIWLVTDGEPTDPIRRAAEVIREGESENRLLFFAVGTKNANFEKLKQLSVRPPVQLDGLNFQEMFKFVSESLQQTSRSRPGDQIELPPPKKFGTIKT